MTCYHVRIEFREPTYELRAGTKQEPYLFGYEVEAASEAKAERQALLEFRQTAELSNVAWIRKVLQVTVTARPDPPEPAKDPAAGRSASVDPRPTIDRRRKSGH